MKYYIVVFLFVISSCLYFAKKCIVSSTEIPKAILNTKIVDGFMGILKKPIKPAVINSGNILGISEIKIILPDRNIHAIKMAINKIAKDKEKTKFLIK